MPFSRVIVSLPIADRRTSFTFYREALGLTATGDLADDGVPEPLAFVLSDAVLLMLIPSGGFGWVIGDAREVAGPGQSECVLNLPVASTGDVDDLLERALQAGAEIVTAPEQLPWGYTGTFCDPDGHVWMVSCQVTVDR